MNATKKPITRSTTRHKAGSATRCIDIYRESFDDASELDFLLSTFPSIPSALPDGTIPKEAFEADLRVDAPLVSDPGFVSKPGDEFVLYFGDVPIEETRLILASPLPSRVDLSVPRDVLSRLDDGVFEVWYRVTVRPTGETLASRRFNATLDRDPAGGALLPPPIFDESIAFFGISLARIGTHPGAGVTCTVPDYYGSADGDELTFKVCLRGDPPLDAGTVKRGEAGDITRFTFTVDILEKLSGNGIVDFYYEVKDKAGNVSKPSFRASSRILIKDAPIDIYAPAVIGMEDRLLTDGDVRPKLSLSIPKSKPTPKAGDLVYVQIDEMAFLPISLSAVDITRDPMVTVSIGYADIVALLEGGEDGTEDFPASYYIVRGNVWMPSQVSQARFDLETAGGRDPNPDTPAHDGMPVPRLIAKNSSIENYVDARTIQWGASVFVNRHSNVVNPALEFGDVVQLFLDDVAISETMIVDESDLPVSAALTAEELRENVGVHALTYTATRTVQESHEVTVTSLAQTIEIHDERSVPGAGLPLPSCRSPAASKRLAAKGWYGLGQLDLAKDQSTIVRLYAWENIAVDDRISLFYAGFDMPVGGKSIPECTGTVQHSVTQDELIPRVDDSDPAHPIVVFFDLTIPGDAMEAIYRGRVHFSYEVEGVYGIGERSQDDVVETDFRWIHGPASLTHL